MLITNDHNLSLLMAVWLLHDNYDYNDEPNYISATSLLRPIKQIILAKHVLSEEKVMDVSERISATLGNAVHDSIESVWRDPKQRTRALKMLGIPDHIRENIVVNPTMDYLVQNPNTIPIYLEYRVYKEINGFKIGAKLDSIIDRKLLDVKSTSVYTYIKSRKDEDHQLQLSIYRWANPELIDGNHGFIQFVFTDWQKFMTYTDENYPKTRIIEHPIPFLSIQETEDFIIHKTNQIKKFWNATEDQLPECTDKDLWRGDTVYKYFSNPENQKATKNFDTDKSAAYAHLSEKGKGVIKEVPGQVKACGYCPAYKVCKQKDRYEI